MSPVDLGFGHAHNLMVTSHLLCWNNGWTYTFLVIISHIVNKHWIESCPVQYIRIADSNWAPLTDPCHSPSASMSSGADPTMRMTWQPPSAPPLQDSRWWCWPWDESACVCHATTFPGHQPLQCRSQWEHLPQYWLPAHLHTRWALFDTVNLVSLDLIVSLGYHCYYCCCYRVNVYAFFSWGIVIFVWSESCIMFLSMYPIVWYSANFQKGNYISILNMCYCFNIICSWLFSGSILLTPS